MNEQRIYTILEQLRRAGDFLTCDNLASILRVSSKTVRKDIQQINKSLIHSKIIVKPSLGIFLDIGDIEELDSFLIQLASRSQLPFTNDDRCAWLLETLISHDTCYLRTVELADSLFVSESVLCTCLKYVRNILQRYSLRLETRPHYGIQIVGSEYDKRICLAGESGSWLLQHLRTTYTKEDIASVSDIAFHCISEHHYNLAHNACEGLVTHLYVMLLRGVIQKKPLEAFVFNIDLHKDETVVAQDIIRRLAKRFTWVPLPEEDIYLAIYFTGNRILNTEEFLTSNYAHICDLVTAMTQRIYQSLGLDFRRDSELRDNLIMHLIPFETRLQSGIQMNNGMLPEIKSKYSLAYNCAIIACGVMADSYGKPVSDDEAGFVALLFCLALERQQNDADRKNILIVCASGQSSSRLLMYELQQKFAPYIRQIRFATILQLEELDPRAWDQIFTTVVLPHDYGIPVLQIGSLFNDQDAINIKRVLLKRSQPFQITHFIRREFFFSDVPCETKNDVFDYLITGIGRTYTLPDCFKEYLLQREKNGKTEFGNLFAIPHPYLPVTEDTFVSVAILRQPIVWDEEKVRLVFLISTSKYSNNHTEQLYKSISQLLDSNTGISKVLKRGDYETLIEVLTKLQNEGD